MLQDVERAQVAHVLLGFAAFMSTCALALLIMQLLHYRLDKEAENLRQKMDTQTNRFHVSPTLGFTHRHSTDYRRQSVDFQIPAARYQPLHCTANPGLQHAGQACEDEDGMHPYVRHQSSSTERDAWPLTGRGPIHSLSKSSLLSLAPSMSSGLGRSLTSSNHDQSEPPNIPHPSSSSLTGSSTPSMHMLNMSSTDLARVYACASASQVDDAMLRLRACHYDLGLLMQQEATSVQRLYSGVK